MARALALLVLAACLAVASAASVMVQPAPQLPSYWHVLGDAAALPVQVTLSLTRINMDKLTEVALGVSDPASPTYTNYMTGPEINAMTRSPEAVAAVTSWLASEGLEFTVAATGAAVEIHGSTAQIEQLLQTTFTVVKNTKTGQKAMRAGDVSLPTSVVDHVDAIFGVHGLPLPPRKAILMRSTPNDDAQNPVTVTPAILRSVYGVNYNATGNVANRQAVAEFQAQQLSQTDLTQFWGQYVKYASKTDDKVYAYKGTDKSQGEGVEAELDIQYIMSVAPGVKTEAWQYGGDDFCTDLKQWTTEILADTAPPNVFSVSYGWQGDMSQIGCSTAEITSIDNDFKSIAAQGVGIIFASGDSGSGYDGNLLYASWPASSTWVTAVGSTRFEGQDVKQPEMGTDQFGSGGGFSAIVTPAPAWQTAAVNQFYATEPASSLPPATIYAKGGRATPDVAALGEGFQVIVGGSVEAVGGTSASAPTFSAMVSLVNDALIAEGKKPMGNLNAFIYANPGVFTDIISGSDRIDRQGSPLQYGFDCVKGWDPVSGFGTMNFPKFLAAAKAAQA